MTDSPSGAARRGGWLLVFGVGLIAAALLAAAALVIVGAQRSDRAVASFARAPAGCETAIRFDRPGTFNVYVESVGRLDGLPGSCPAPIEFDRGGEPPVQVQVTLTDPDDGSTVRLGRTTPLEYERAGFAGVRFRTVTVDGPVTVVAEVRAPAGEHVVVAFGPDPDQAGGRLALTGIIIGLIGAVVGFALFVAGLIRRFAGPSTRPPTGMGDPSTWSRPIGPPGSPLPPPPPPGVKPPVSDGRDAAGGSSTNRSIVRVRVCA